MSLTKCKISVIIPRTTALTGASHLSYAGSTQTFASDEIEVQCIANVWYIFLIPGPSDLRMPECLHPCSFRSVPSVVVSREVPINLASSEPFHLSLVNDGVEPAEVRGRSLVGCVRDGRRRA
jgi:hypothetical protein